MNSRVAKVPTHPTKNQETAIDFKGKTYAVCTDGQMNFLIEMAKDKFRAEAFDKKVKLSEEELEKKLKEYRETCGYATLDWILGQMTPQERTDWQNKYRFTPIMRTIK